MSFQWIILFDWDGTLIDSLPTKVRNASLLFHQEFGVPPDDVALAYRKMSGIPRKQLFASICADTRLPPLSDDVYQRLSQRFTELNLSSLTDPDTSGILAQETLDTLRTLKDSGYPLYVSSSADPNEIRKVASALGLESFFTEIMGSLPGFGKGAQHVAHVLESQSASAEQLVFVGDEPADISLGHAAGIRTVGKLGTCSAEALMKERPEHLINTLSELPALLAGLKMEDYANDHR